MRLLNKIIIQGSELQSKPPPSSPLKIISSEPPRQRPESPVSQEDEEVSSISVTASHSEATKKCVARQCDSVLPDSEDCTSILDRPCQKIVHFSGFQPQTKTAKSKRLSMVLLVQRAVCTCQTQSPSTVLRIVFDGFATTVNATQKLIMVKPLQGAVLEMVSFLLLLVLSYALSFCHYCLIM